MILHISVNFYLTWKCNLQCKHCQYKCHPNETKEMTDEQIEYALGIIRKINKSTTSRIVVIGLTGGEPMLHPRFWSLVNALYTIKQACNSFPLELHTNGTQPIDKDMITAFPFAFDTTFIGCDAYHEEAGQKINAQELSKISRAVVLRRTMIPPNISSSWVRMMGRAKENFENQISSKEPCKDCTTAKAEYTHLQLSFTPDTIKFCGEIGRDEYLPHNNEEYKIVNEITDDYMKSLIMKSLYYSIYCTGPQCLTPCIYKVVSI